MELFKIFLEFDGKWETLGYNIYLTAMFYQYLKHIYDIFFRTDDLYFSENVLIGIIFKQFVIIIHHHFQICIKNFSSIEFLF